MSLSTRYELQEYVDGVAARLSADTPIGFTKCVIVFFAIRRERLSWWRHALVLAARWMIRTGLSGHGDQFENGKQP